ncbi:hypothetical protein AXG93_3890s1080 [Marchantia polymorpha subsp. ruderalis]|uniref:Cytochrome P450 n=1 Tax=Marchantia polymorpha subsp. ruderalis TaxID=1480154 RepID=A0A176WEK9_MARPO|nr:hypothetical protein AXG93_3890s1080 [Marchantia polymorpha subsp. ruderalis]
MATAMSVILMALAALLFVSILRNVMILFRVAIWERFKVIRMMKKEGYSGPPFSVFSDNLEESRAMKQKARKANALQRFGTVDHDIWDRVHPDIKEWKNLYGEKLFCRPEKHLIVLLGFDEPDVVRTMFAHKTDEFSKGYSPLAETVLGKGGLALTVDHESWARQRRVVRPVFYASYIKDTTKVMTPIVTAWLKTLKDKATGSGGSVEVDIFKYLGTVVRDVLAQFNLMIKCRLLPTPRNWQIRRTRSAVTRCMKAIIQKRRMAFKNGALDSLGDDLLGVLLNAVEDDVAALSDPKQKIKKHAMPWTDDLLVDQCRTFFQAGTNTVSVTTSWVLILLANYPEWQERIRKEVLDNSPVCENLHKLESLRMFVRETQRMYPTAPALTRTLVKDGVSLLGNSLPKNLTVRVDVIRLHRNRETWGDDADEFKPERFKNGIAQACKHPYGFIPFGAGPRTCVAQNFAIAEVELVTSMILEHFRFRLSPSYCDMPMVTVVLQPACGATLILELLKP